MTLADAIKVAITAFEHLPAMSRMPESERDQRYRYWGTILQSCRDADHARHAAEWVMANVRGTAGQHYLPTEGDLNDGKAATLPEEPVRDTRCGCQGTGWAVTYRADSHLGAARRCSSCEYGRRLIAAEAAQRGEEQAAGSTTRKAR